MILALAWPLEGLKNALSIVGQPIINCRSHGPALPRALAVYIGGYTGKYKGPKSTAYGLRDDLGSQVGTRLKN